MSSETKHRVKLVDMVWSIKLDKTPIEGGDGFVLRVNVPSCENIEYEFTLEEAEEFSEELDVLIKHLKEKLIVHEKRI